MSKWCGRKLCQHSLHDTAHQAHALRTLVARAEKMSVLEKAMPADGMIAARLP
jgi:hypothetical protein